MTLISLSNKLIKNSLGFIFLIICWFFLAETLGASRLPSPTVIVERFISVLFASPEISAQGGGADGIYPHFTASIIRVYIGGTVGIVLGVLCGLIISLNKIINEIFQPIIEIFRAIPPLAIAPLLLIWFGPTSTSQYIMLISYTFLTLTVYTYEAIKNVDPLIIKYAQTVGANKNQIFRTVVLPSIIPELIGGIRVSIALSWSIAVVSELLGAKFGIGKIFSMMLVAQGLDIIIISIIYVTFIAALTDQIFLTISNFFTRWVDR